ncbi:hypothetical protein [Yinghuangia sp. YIM S10712]|uniref:hypothetical protein n=1 Tax=Yinghuangia sp. YIM S10712 TaxID=3436930 RepID=UPI003F531831
MTALRGTLASEWIKLWTVRSTWWSLGAAVVLMGACTAIMGADFASDVENGQTNDGTTMRIGEPAANAALLAQFGLIAVAMLTVTGEFATGAMRGTLAADPRRGRVLFAKTAAVTAVVLPLALVLAMAGVAIGDASLGTYGEQRAVAADIACVTAYFWLAAVFTLGLGALLRSSVATLSTVIAVLLAMPMMFSTGWSDVLPGRAGLSLLGWPDPPYSRPVAFAVLAAWALAAQLAGWAALRRRDV